MWMLYAQVHWTKAYDLKSAVERLYEELGALEFDADHEEIYAIERYYTVQQGEEINIRLEGNRGPTTKYPDPILYGQRRSDYFSYTHHDIAADVQIDKKMNDNVISLDFESVCDVTTLCDHTYSKSAPDVLNQFTQEVPTKTHIFEEDNGITPSAFFLTNLEKVKEVPTKTHIFEEDNGIIPSAFFLTNLEKVKEVPTKTHIFEEDNGITPSAFFLTNLEKVKEVPTKTHIFEEDNGITPSAFFLTNLEKVKEVPTKTHIFEEDNGITPSALFLKNLEKVKEVPTKTHIFEEDIGITPSAFFLTNLEKVKEVLQKRISLKKITALHRARSS
ncbi:hypothetical protein FQA39_LY17683 [Lamprigera yunnana]|nr:hypothetical protein FQA39_LY17683 [Lamprigera yunnana]